MTAAAVQISIAGRANTDLETPAKAGKAAPYPWVEALYSPALSAAKIAVSCDQRLVGQPLVDNAFDEAFQPVKRVPLHVAFVQPEGELVNVARRASLQD